MNYVNVLGGQPYQQKRVESVVDYCITKLMPRMQTLDIDVRLKDLKGDAYGYCLCLDKRTFELEIEKKLNLKTLLTTVAHEMVHVKQYARAELTEGTWQGKLINPKQSYWDRGYEIEAHGREYGLFVRWAEANKLSERQWTHED
mgnify:FL=1|tara:strand:- start:103 stop:534 length:432 start_codon:yes stop_codon:yes gene_type:complete